MSITSGTFFFKASQAWISVAVSEGLKSLRAFDLLLAYISASAEERVEAEAIGKILWRGRLAEILLCNYWKSVRGAKCEVRVVVRSWQRTLKAEKLP